MTEEEYNEALKELGVVLLDVDYTKLKTTLDVAKIVIHLNKINERIVLEDNDFYQKENAELKAKLKEYEKKEKLYSYLEGRFVECIQSCTQEEKEKCPMFPEFCEGEHTKFVDIVELLNKKGEIR